MGIRSEEGRMDSSADLVAGSGQADTVRDVPAAMREAVHLLAAPGGPHPRDLTWAVQRWLFLVRLKAEHLATEHGLWYRAMTRICT